MISAAYAGLYELLRASFKIGVGTQKKQAYSDDLMFLKIPAEYAIPIASAVYSTS